MMANVYKRIAADQESLHRNVPPGMLILHWFGGWLPRDHRVLKKWLDKRIAAIDERNKKGTRVELDPSIQQFKDVIESNPEIYMGFHEMFTQVPEKSPYNNDPTAKPQVRSASPNPHLLLTACW